MGCDNSLPRDLELPQRDKERASQRQTDIANNRKLYEWYHFADGSQPSHIKTLPPEEKDAADKKWHSEQVFDIVKSGVSLGISKFFDELTDIFQRDGPFQDYSEVYGANCKKPAVSARWRDDAEFARQKLQGVLPNQIRRIRELPAKFPVKEEHVDGVLPPGETLASMLQKGRVYLVDYEFIDAARAVSPPERNMCAPLMLFFVNNDNVLMPAAIQLGQDPSQFPVLSPEGPDRISNRWMVAKILCNSSEGCLHEVANHLLMTHFAGEIVYVSLKRTLSQFHPLNQLLGAHFWFTLFINDGARTTLIKDDNSAVPKIMAMGYKGMAEIYVKAWKEYTMETYNIEDGFKQRDVMELPGYWYRDDALLVWNSIHGYVKQVIGEFYKEDKDVTEDAELQAFVAEVTDPKIGNLRGSPFGTSMKAATIAQVERFCTQVIWMVTAYHAALNNGQYDYFGFIPNAPGAFAIPPPSKDKEFTLEQIADAFPKPGMAAYQISFIHVLAMGTDQPLAQFTHDQNYMKAEPACTKHWEAWKKDLQRISGLIKERNKSAPVPYTYLDPEQIANSVAI